MDSPIDAVGHPLVVGDHVAHVARFGSTIRITRRVIAEVGLHNRNGRQELGIRFADTRAWALATNTVKVSAP